MTSAAEPRPDAGRPLGRVDHVLRVVGWVVLVVGTTTAVLVPGTASDPLVSLVVLLTLVGMFSVMVVRLVLALRAATRARVRWRRPALLVLAAGIFTWAVGSGVLAATATTVVDFPSPSEIAFLVAYALLAAYVVVEARWRRTQRLRMALEAAVLLAAGVSLTAFAVLTPVRLLFPVDGIGLVLAALWPLLDLTFVVLLLVQTAVGQRERSRRTVFLVAGFLALLVADSLFLVQVNAGYQMSLLADFFWGAGFALLVEGAVRPPRADPPTPRQAQRPVLLLAASLAALVVLVVSPAGAEGWTTTLPAALTLLCAGALMATSLREANRSAEAFRLSRTDELTDLPNRRALLGDLSQLVSSPHAFALLLLDLDGFKDINDSLGHGAGDEVLQVLSGRLADSAEQRAEVYRLGGDEFAMLARHGDQLRLHELAEDVRDAVAHPLLLSGIEVVVGASVGITVREPDDQAGSDLLRRADVAMYEAKSTRAGVLAYDRTQDGFSRERLELVESLRHAIGGAEFEMWYQPQVDARSREVIGLEALLRWNHPQLGLLAPVDFLGQARTSGLMPAISEEVLRLVTIEAVRWGAQDRPVRVSFNCAPPELQNAVFLRQVADTVVNSGLERDALLVEVTEDSFLADPHTAREKLQVLRQHGVQVAIDDYGTGFSSLAYLRDLPVQELKIDRSFVATLRTDRRSRVIVQTTTQMAHALGLRVVAEGVEDERTAAELRALDVDVLQGYGIARPMPAADVHRWVAGWTPSAPVLRL